MWFLTMTWNDILIFYLVLNDPIRDIITIKVNLSKWKVAFWMNYDKNPKQPLLGQLWFLSVYSIKQRQFAVKHNILSGYINTMVGIWIWQIWFGGVWFVFSNLLSCTNLCWSNITSFNEFIFYKIHLNAYWYARVGNGWSFCELSPKVAIFSVIKLLLMSLVHVSGGFLSRWWSNSWI